MFRYRFARYVNLIMLIVFVQSFFQPQSVVQAATPITVELLTWNVIGLDSNNVNVGPNKFLLWGCVHVIREPTRLT